MAGYSGTPLWKKLGLKEGMSAAVVNPPANYHEELLAGAPDALWGQVRPNIGFVHIFATIADQLALDVGRSLDLLDRNGMIWASWPKRSSGVRTDLTEDTIREIALPMGLVDVKVCAVDEIWAGLKLVIRRELR